MKSILIVFYCSVAYGVTAQAPNVVTTQATVPVKPSNWEEFTSSHQTFKEAAVAKKDKFSCVLNLLKNALSEELENSQFHITPETTQDSVLASINFILEEEQMKKEYGEQDRPGMNDEAAEKALYQKIITKIASAFSKPQNASNNQNNVEMPSMIPIFKQRQAMSRSELRQNAADFNPTAVAPVNRQAPKSKPITFVPERIIQTNMGPISNPPVFNIPCQRAIDVLDMTNISPKGNVGVRPKVNPILEDRKPNLFPPVTVSVDNSDETVAMLFKPKNITLKQIYGNLLKKFTITVLVPYHMSKLGEK